MLIRHEVTLKMDPQVIAVVREINESFRRWLDRTEFPQEVYDKMLATKANLENNFR